MNYQVLFITIILAIIIGFLLLNTLETMTGDSGAGASAGMSPDNYAYTLGSTIKPTSPSLIGSTPTSTSQQSAPPPMSSLENMTMLCKYLILLLRQREAQDELYKLANGHSRVYRSPKLDHINDQIAKFKQQLTKDPATLKFFTDNADLMIF